MNKITAFLLYIYIFFASWMSAYKLHELLPIPNIILLAAAFSYSLIVLKTRKVVKNVYKLEDSLLILFIFIMLISLLFNGGNKNYIIAYIFIFIINYLFIKSAYFKLADINKCFHINGIAIIFVSLFIIAEFSIHYLFEINIRELLLFGSTPSATYLGIFHRSYGFSAEPTNLGLYLNTMGPLGIWYWVKHRKLKTFQSILIVLIVFLGWITTFSAAAFISLFIGLIMAAFSYVMCGNKIIISKKILLMIMLLSIVLVISLILYKSAVGKDLNLGDYIKPIMIKLTLVSQADQEESRINRWRRDFTRFKENPILGYGPGMTTVYHGGSSVNWYLNILVENGIIALSTIITFFFIIFLRIRKSEVDNKYYFYIGFISAVIHLSAVSTFYDPALWILLILFNVFNEKHLVRNS